MLLVRLNNQLQHARAQQGSEHYLAHILTAITEFEVPHSALVAQCLIFAATLHGQDVTPVRNAMQQAGIPLDRVRPTDFAVLLEYLDSYLGEYDFPYSILNDLDPDSEHVQQAREIAGLVVAPETWEQPGAVRAETGAEASAEVAPAEAAPAEPVEDAQNIPPQAETAPEPENPTEPSPAQPGSSGDQPGDHTGTS